MFEDLLQDFHQYISVSSIYDSVERVCDFFHIEEPSTISEGWATGVYTNDVYNSSDDVLIYSSSQLEGMGIVGQDALDLVMTHEGTHRMLQGMDIGFNSYQEELCCDFMAGVRAGLNNLDVNQLEQALGNTLESDTHPAGGLRVEAIENGIEFAHQFMLENGISPSFTECLDSFKTGLLIEHQQVNLREEMDLQESIMRHHQRMMEKDGEIELTKELHNFAQSEYEQAKAKYDHFLYDQQQLNGDEHSNISFKGIPINDKAYCEKMAKHYFEQEEIERKGATNAIANGNKTAATRHQNAAETNHDLGVRYQEMSKKSTK